MSVVGGMNVRAAGLRLNATSPFARLSVSDDGVRLSGNGLLRRLLPQRTCTFADLEFAQAVRGWTSTGVALHVRGGSLWYFWTKSYVDVLGVLSSHGVSTRDELKRVHYSDQTDWP